MVPEVPPSFVITPGVTGTWDWTWTKDLIPGPLYESHLTGTLEL